MLPSWRRRPPGPERREAPAACRGGRLGYLQDRPQRRSIHAQIGDKRVQIIFLEDQCVCRRPMALAAGHSTRATHANRTGRTRTRQRSTSDARQGRRQHMPPSTDAAASAASAPLRRPHPPRVPPCGRTCGCALACCMTCRGKLGRKTGPRAWPAPAPPAAGGLSTGSGSRATCAACLRAPAPAKAPAASTRSHSPLD